MQLRVLICVCCRYAGDSQFQVSVTGIPAGIKDVQVLSVGIVNHYQSSCVGCTSELTIEGLRGRTE